MEEEEEKNNDILAYLNSESSKKYRVIYRHSLCHFREERISLYLAGECLDH